MRLKRVYFRFNRLVNVDDIIGNSNLLLMEQEDINVDNNVHDYILRIICANFYIIAKKKRKVFISFAFYLYHLRMFMIDSVL